MQTQPGIQFTVAALIPGPWGPVSAIDDTRERDPQPNASKHRTLISRGAALTRVT
jgi:hypothetical protein